MSSIKFESLNFFHKNLAKYTPVYYVFIIIQYHMILFFPGAQNFVLSFMDKTPLPILMRWIFGPLGRGSSRPLSGVVYHKFGQNV